MKEDLPIRYVPRYVVKERRPDPNFPEGTAYTFELVRDPYAPPLFDEQDSRLIKQRIREAHGWPTDEAKNH